MRKQYGSEDVEYNFSEDVSNDLIEVNFDNTALFDDVEQTISLDKDGSFTDLEVVNQLSPELLEGVDTDKLTDDVKRDLSEHIHLNQMQNSINLEVKDIEYDTGVEDFPQAIINVDFEGETYTNYASLDKEYQKGSEVYITDDSF